MTLDELNLQLYTGREIEKIGFVFDIWEIAQVLDSRNVRTSTPSSRMLIIIPKKSSLLNERIDPESAHRQSELLESIELLNNEEYKLL